MAVRQRQFPSRGSVSPRERPGLGDLLIPDGEEIVDAGAVPPSTDIAYVTEEMDFRHSGGQMVETVETTTLDERGHTSSATVTVHPVN